MGLVNTLNDICESLNTCRLRGERPLIVNRYSSESCV